MAKAEKRHHEAARDWYEDIPAVAPIPGIPDAYAMGLAAGEQAGREAGRRDVAEVVERTRSGEEAECVDGMDGSEGTYADSFDDGVRFVLDRLSAHDAHTTTEERDDDTAMECPCCGGLGVEGMVTDGTPLLCGCKGAVSYDGESEPWINVADDCPCTTTEGRDE